jgi:hypothetical protein
LLAAWAAICAAALVTFSSSSPSDGWDFHNFFKTSEYDYFFTMAPV